MKGGDRLIKVYADWDEGCDYGVKMRCAGGWRGYNQCEILFVKHIFSITNLFF